MKAMMQGLIALLLLIAGGPVVMAGDVQIQDEQLPPELESQSFVAQSASELKSQSSVETPRPEMKGGQKSAPKSVEIKAHRYSGDLNKLEEDLLAAGYKELSGMLAKGGDATHPFTHSSEVAAAKWCILDASKRPVVPKRCVYAVQTIVQRNSNGDPIFHTEDALEFAPVSGYKFLDDDTNCASPLYPYRSIVAIGSFKLREAPGYGGYAEDIRQAWVIDIESRRFVEISTKEVTCEVNEDRD